METLHHAIMSERWAKSRNMSDEMASELTFWSMAPDAFLALTGYSARPATHLEEPGYEGCALHRTREDLSALYVSPVVPVPVGLACAAKVGIHLHLVQDRTYDAWISEWVGAVHDEECGAWRYFSKHGGHELSWTDVALLKRWSWRCAWIEELGNCLSESDLRGETMPDELIRYLNIAKSNRFYHPAMEEALIELWTCEMEQSSPPEALAEHEKEMLDGLRKAWTAWESEL